MNSSLGLSRAALPRGMLTFLSPCTISELPQVYQNATQPEWHLQEILVEPKLRLLKTISFKNLHPIFFHLCYQGPRSMAWVVALNGTSHTWAAVVREPGPKLFASWEAFHTHWPNSEGSLYRQGQPRALTESMNHKVPFSLLSAGSVVQRGHRFVFLNWHMIYNE